MMHQNILDTNDSNSTMMRRCLVTSIEAIVAQLDLIQVTLMMDRLGGYGEEQFVIDHPKHVYLTTLQGLCKNFNNINRPLDSIPIIFDGGPTGHTQFKASVAAFVADRVLVCIRKHGRKHVCEIIEDVIAWKSGEYEEEKNLEWDDLDASSRYAG